MKHDIFEMMNTIERLNHNLTPTLTRLLEQQNRLREIFRPATSALATAMEANYLALSKVSDALLPVAKEWEAVADFIREQDYSHLFITDSLSSKLMNLIESMEEEVPDIKEEIIQATSFDIVIDESSPKPKLDLNQMIAIITIILMVLGMFQTQYNADQSGIQTERHHQERMEQMDRHHQEMRSLISELYSYLTSENKTNSKDQ